MLLEKFSNFYTPKEQVVLETSTETTVDSVTTLNESMQKTATIIGLFESLSADLNLVHKDELESVSKLIIEHVSSNIDNLKSQLKDLSKKDLNLVNENIKILSNKVTSLNDHANTNFEKYSKLVYDTAITLEEKIKAVEIQDLVREDLSDLAKEVVRVEEETKQDLKKQAKLVYETATGLDDKIKSIKVVDFTPSINELQNQINVVQESINGATKLQEDTAEKYNKLVYESALTLEQKINGVSSLVDQKVNSIVIPDYSYLEEQVKTVQDQVLEINNKKPVPDVSDKVTSIEKRLNVVEDKRLKEQKKATSQLKEEITSLESHISKFNDKIVEQNNKYTQLEKNTKLAIAEAKRLLVDNKYAEINKKIAFIEQVLEKFNDKTILTEGILDAPPATKTSDPLTPLNQNFVTFEQLQKHYSLFINRIQQQLTSIGGGGTVWLYDLDDVNYNSVKNASNGDVLSFNAANSKWEAAVVSGGGAGAYGDTNVYANVSLLLPSYATTTFVTNEVANLIAAAPATLDTLNELAAALGNDNNFSTAVVTQLSTKANTASLTTANVTELTNLYFSNARVYSNVITLGYITSSALSGYATNVQLTSYATTANLSLKANIVDLTTANVTELTNQYFTNARATAAVTRSTLSNLTVQGNITVTTGTINAVDVAATGNITSPYFYSQSDINLKKDLIRVTDALDIVNQLEGYRFKWKNNDADSIGLIAQYVESVLPMLIGSAPDGTKTVLYNGLIAILLEAIKAQQVQIDEIKAIINEKH